MRPPRNQALDAIEAGDVIFGIAAGGQEKILLVYKADETHVFARHITTQTKVKFDRNGNSQRTWDGGSCTIVSTAALSTDDYETAIGLDQKMRTAKELTDLRLSEAEIRLLLTIPDYFKARPLPA